MNNSLGVVVAIGTGRSALDTCQGQDIYLLYKTSRPALGNSQPHISERNGVLSWVEEKPGTENYHLPTSTVSYSREYC
jgi:hypothetical protein